MTTLKIWLAQYPSVVSLATALLLVAACMFVVWL